MLKEGAPLSRNRHFYTFLTPEGRAALRIARQLRSIARDIEATDEAPIVRPEAGRVRVEIPLAAGHRVAWLEAEEFELLRGMPSVRASLPAATISPR
jgi:hypothetical protein